MVAVACLLFAAGIALLVSGGKSVGFLSSIIETVVALGFIASGGLCLLFAILKGAV